MFLGLSLTLHSVSAQFFIDNLYARHEWTEWQHYSRLSTTANDLPLICQPNPIAKELWGQGETLLINEQANRAKLWEEEIATYKFCIKADSSFCDAYFRLAQSLVMKSDWVTALNILQIAKQKFPNEPLVYMGLGQIFLVLQYPSLALANYKKLIEVLPKSPEGYLGCSMSLFELNRDEEALKFLQQKKKKHESKLDLP